MRETSGGRLRAAFVVVGALHAFGVLEPAVASRWCPFVPPAPVDEEQPLAQTLWAAIEIRGRPLPEEGRLPQLILSDEGGRVAGSTGCNRLMSRYESTDGDLTFGKVAYTRMPCPEGATTERVYLDALSRVARYEVEGKYLRVYDAAGNLLIRFEAVQRPGSE